MVGSFVLVILAFFALWWFLPNILAFVNNKGLKQGKEYKKKAKKK